MLRRLCIHYKLNTVSTDLFPVLYAENIMIGDVNWERLPFTEFVLRFDHEPRVRLFTHDVGEQACIALRIILLTSYCLEAETIPASFGYSVFR